MEREELFTLWCAEVCRRVLGAVFDLSWGIAAPRGRPHGLSEYLLVVGPLAFLGLLILPTIGQRAAVSLLVVFLVFAIGGKFLLLALNTDFDSVFSLLYPCRERLFIYYTFSILGRLSKIDGHVTEQEIRKVRAYMQVELKLSEAEVERAVAAFRLGAGSENLDVERCGRLIRLLVSNEPALISGIIKMLRDLARADGNVSPAEMELIELAWRGLGWDLGGAPFSRRSAVFEAEREAGARRGQSRREGNADGAAKEHYQSAPEERGPYAVFGISRQATNAELKRAYRRLCRQYHPDAALSRGVPQSYLAECADKFKKVQAAWDEIRAERGMH